ncbi:hypothetical protein [Microbacterium sp.]|uniref:hypothetical protein n=1 Tax=Microbacterium sp. TaxID=51671 RepID=UPI00261D3FF1|nr:hypothetical protein [Microbacterium sp.]
MSTDAHPVGWLTGFGTLLVVEEVSDDELLDTFCGSSSDHMPVPALTAWMKTSGRPSPWLS